MRKHADKSHHIKGSVCLLCILGLLFFSACSSYDDTDAVDKLNCLSYAYHYRNLDSVSTYAQKALSLSANYPTGKAEAYNNLAFVCIAKMEYETAGLYLDSVESSTDNQVELLLADIQHMKLCQRESKNRAFYDYKERAEGRIKRISEEQKHLSEHETERYVYAKTEFPIVCSTYYYYVGLTKQSIESLNLIEQSGEIQSDTAQYLNYLYQLGSGGMIKANSREETIQKEFECLIKCNILAERSGMTYWQANSLQSISEHLLDFDEGGDNLLMRNKAAFEYLNKDNMPDSLLAGYLAQKSLNLFIEYGDVYQTAGAYRTLSFCYWNLGDYTSALICLDNALTRNKAIEKSPSQVASIRECLSIVYSAIGDKYNSDINRNKYLDIQEYTRQDRQLEARAEQLERTSAQQNLLIAFILVLIAIVVLLLFVFNRLGKQRKNKERYIEKLLAPLKAWEQANEHENAKLDDEYDTVCEQLEANDLQLAKYKRLNIENKAKIFIVNNVVPYIDRIICEAKRLEQAEEQPKIRQERLTYIAELADRINEYNNVLTHWIRIQQGSLSLKIESFNLKDVFEIVAKSGMAFQLKGVKLDVKPLDVYVKADKILTVFMLNTIADNARKFTSNGGVVEIYATKEIDYVEISVKDSGIGLKQDELASIFNNKIHDGHGFGLTNCQGIINKYKKTSRIFNVCGLFAESEKGKGSRFFFRLPYGMVRLFIFLFLSMGLSGNVKAQNKSDYYLIKADAYADSAYYSNVDGTYEKTLAFADSVCLYLNKHNKSVRHNGQRLISLTDGGHDTPAEILWLRHKVETDYEIILDMRNESAIAALALHKWALYQYNNDAYTSLFKQLSADKGLEEYCLTMQNSSTNKTIAVIVLVLLLVFIVSAFYFLYYRHVLYFRFCVDKVEMMNNVLLSNKPNEDKLSFINNIDISRYPSTLQNVTLKIKEALTKSIKQHQTKILKIEQANDYNNKLMYEADKLYVSNNIIDNSLSTLKHETMYYPSRIRQLVDDVTGNIGALTEVAAYYKEIYSMLCKQVNIQSEMTTFECKPVAMDSMLGINEWTKGDPVLLAYLFEILKKQFKFTEKDVSVLSATGKYVVIGISCHSMILTEKQCQDLFTPSTNNLPFLVCRQIIRTCAEQTNLYGCGIDIMPGDNGCTQVNVTLARYTRNETKNHIDNNTATEAQA